MHRLFITFEALGDAVMRCGVLRELARDGRLDLAGKPYLGLYAEVPWIGRLLDARPLERRRHPWLDPLVPGRAELLAHLKAEAYDEIVCYERDARRGLRRWFASRLPGVPLRVIPHRAGRPAGHETEDGRRMLDGLGLAAPDFNPVPHLDLTPARLAEADALLAPLPGPVVCFQPGTALATVPWWDFKRQALGNPKAVPAATWATLATRLLTSGAAGTIACIGSPAERPLAEAIRALLPPDLAARVTLSTVGLSVPAMAAVVRRAALLVSIDTGPAHVAAAVGARVLVVFGPTDPARYAPRGPGVVRTLTHDVPCRPCHGTPAAKACRDNVCLRLLPAERLAAEALAMLRP